MEWSVVWGRRVITMRRGGAAVGVPQKSLRIGSARDKGGELRVLPGEVGPPVRRGLLGDPGGAALAPGAQAAGVHLEGDLDAVRPAFDRVVAPARGGDALRAGQPV